MTGRPNGDMRGRNRSFDGNRMKGPRGPRPLMALRQGPRGPPPGFRPPFPPRGFGPGPFFPPRPPMGPPGPPGAFFAPRQRPPRGFMPPPPPQPFMRPPMPRGMGPPRSRTPGPPQRPPNPKANRQAVKRPGAPIDAVKPVPTQKKKIAKEIDFTNDSFDFQSNDLGTAF